MTNEKSGLFKLGYVMNKKTYVNELNKLLDSQHQLSLPELNDLVDNAETVYINRYGYNRDKNNMPVKREKASYLQVNINLEDKNGRKLIGWFERKPNENVFKGVIWGTEDELQEIISHNKMFHLGELCFRREEDGVAFMEDIAANILPETWAFKNKHSQFNHPILKSYLENIFKVLKHEHEKGGENKLVFSKDGKHMMFNTNLLDRFSHDVIVMVEVCKNPCTGNTIYMNPHRVKKDSELMKRNFERGIKPAQPTFFKSVEEVMFQTEWLIDNDFDKLTHIIDQRRNRFPIGMQSESPDTLARKLEGAISFAVAIAKRNYKFVVPMFCPNKSKIQMLMPIYMNGLYSAKPDFALILTPDSTNECYTLETILPLEAVYQNARLIAKPDETWLNPDNIL